MLRGGISCWHYAFPGGGRSNSTISIKKRMDGFLLLFSQETQMSTVMSPSRPTKYSSELV